MKSSLQTLAAFVVGLAATLAQSQPVAPAPDLATNPPPVATRINPALPSIFIAGDSTAARSSATNQQGWGTPFAKYFDAEKVNVVNRARGGRSSRTFITEGLWDQLLADVKTNDLVLIQFGHNDAGAINDASRARGSLRGLGEETEAIDNLVTKRPETVHTFGWYIRKMIADVKAKGAKPVLLSLTIRNLWNDGQIERGSGSYGAWLAESARIAGVPFIDVSQLVADKLEPLGEQQVSALYPRDHTHFNATGADLHARFVVIGLKQLEGQPVNAWLSAAGRELGEKSGEPKAAAPRVGPVHPGFNQNLPTVWLIGDSTVRNGRGDGAGGLWGWGDPLAACFDKTKINVENQALGGTSSRSFLTTKLWEAVRSQVKPGDFVILQFGHNDGGGAYDDNRARKSIKGSGDDTIEVTLATGVKETVHTYGWYLRRFVADTKAAGATPIVCSPIPRNDWTDGKVHRAADSYGRWAREAAAASGALFIDLNRLVADRYDQLGEAAVKPFFPKEHTHTGWDGAVVNAQCVVAGLKALPDCRLREFLPADAATPHEPGNPGPGK
jgi:lysophospholipase L1-like esterase